MATELTEVQKREAVASVSRNEIINRALEKLNRKLALVDVPRNLNMIESIEMMIATKKASSDQTEETKNALLEAEQQVASLKQDRIRGVLLPLKTSDLLIVQGVVAETSIKARDMELDLDVQLFLMAKAERCATAYVALRKQDRQSERYFQTQEEVALLDDRVLLEIARVYSDSFVLTEEERKNSYGAPRS
jgi:hypothetical protein